MLVHPWDAPTDDAEWRTWLAGRDFGQLVAGGRDRDLPVVVPKHFSFDGESTVWLHLARPNPVWQPLEERPRALLTVIGRAKFKYGGNKSAEHRVELAARLAERSGPMDAVAREHLLRRWR